MDVANSVTDHDAVAVRCQRNGQGRTVQRHFGPAGTILDIPEPERAVIGAGQRMSPVRAYRNRAHRSGVLVERKPELTG